MRINRLLPLVAVVSLLAAPSILLASTASSDGSASVKAAPSKVCNPKKPTFCRAADLSVVAEGTQASVPVVDEAIAIAAINAAICTGPRYYCRTQTLGGTSVSVKESASVTPRVEEKQAAINAAICTGPRYYCRTQTLGGSSVSVKESASVTPRVEEKQAAINAAICTGPRYYCRTQTLG